MADFMLRPTDLLGWGVQTALLPMGTWDSPVHSYTYYSQLVTREGELSRI